MCYGNSTFNTGQRINGDGGSGSSTSSSSNVDGEYNSENDEYNCGRDFVGCSINTNVVSWRRISKDGIISFTNDNIIHKNCYMRRALY